MQAVPLLGVVADYSFLVMDILIHLQHECPSLLTVTQTVVQDLELLVHRSRGRSLLIIELHVHVLLDISVVAEIADLVSRRVVKQRLVLVKSRGSCRRVVVLERALAAVHQLLPLRGLIVVVIHY